MFLHIFFIKIFEDSSCEEALLGPKTVIFSSHNLSTIPLLRGSSGPTTTKSILYSLQKCNNISIIHRIDFKTVWLFLESSHCREYKIIYYKLEIYL